MFVVRLWKTVKYEDIYLRAYDTVNGVNLGIERYLDFYNRRRPHQLLDGIQADRLYYDNLPKPEMVA